MTTAQQLRDYLAWIIETGRGDYAACIDPQDLCWGCPTMALGHVSVIGTMLPDSAADGINDARREIFIGARVMERKT